MTAKKPALPDTVAARLRRAADILESVKSASAVIGVHDALSKAEREITGVSRVTYSKVTDTRAKIFRAIRLALAALSEVCDDPTPAECGLTGGTPIRSSWSNLSRFAHNPKVDRRMVVDAFRRAAKSARR